MTLKEFIRKYDSISKVSGMSPEMRERGRKRAAEMVAAAKKRQEEERERKTRNTPSKTISSRRRELARLSDQARAAEKKRIDAHRDWKIQHETRGYASAEKMKRVTEDAQKDYRRRLKRQFSPEERERKYGQEMLQSIEDREEAAGDYLPTEKEKKQLEAFGETLQGRRRKGARPSRWNRDAPKIPDRPKLKGRELKSKGGGMEGPKVRGSWSETAGKVQQAERTKARAKLAKQKAQEAADRAEESRQKKRSVDFNNAFVNKRIKRALETVAEDLTANSKIGQYSADAIVSSIHEDIGPSGYNMTDADRSVLRNKVENWMKNRINKLKQRKK